MRDADYSLRLDVNPIAWKAPTAFARRIGGRLAAGVAPAPELVAYERAVSSLLAAQWDRPPIEVPCRVDFRFARRLERYKSPTSDRMVTKHRVDLTNMRKATEDAMQPNKHTGFGGVVKNDVLIVQGWTEIVSQSRDVEYPYIEVDIWLL